MKWSINMVLCAAPCDKEATSTCWQRREKYLKAFGKSESSDSGGRRQNQQAKGKEECLEQTTVYVILWAAVFWDESTSDLLYYSSLYWNSSKWTMSTQFPDSRAGIRHCLHKVYHPVFSIAVEGVVGAKVQSVNTGNYPCNNSVKVYNQILTSQYGEADKSLAGLQGEHQGQ